MQLTAHHLGQAFRIRLSWPASRPAAPRAIGAAPGSGDSARHSGAPQDRALYACGCGFAWTTDVVATVDCPHCGSRQAW